MPQTDEAKPDQPEGAKRAAADLASAYQRIKATQEELARLGRRVSGMKEAMLSLLCLLR